MGKDNTSNGSSRKKYNLRNRDKIADKQRKRNESSDSESESDGESERESES